MDITAAEYATRTKSKTGEYQQQFYDFGASLRGQKLLFEQWKVSLLPTHLVMDELPPPKKNIAMH